MKDRLGPLAFARLLLNDQAWFGSMWRQIGLLRDKPVLLLWGMKDPFISKGDLEKRKGAFPNAVVKTLDDAGHFPQDEASEAVVQAVDLFLKN